MITTDYVRAYLNAQDLSEVYAEKLIEYSNGDINKLDNILIQKKYERETRQDIYEYEVSSDVSIRFV
ncbi:hypothetical protein [Staphylococcus equorum]|uniref:hypothetical protein n=1 Tax=Staphylococcus equorum TaxID=246432 RepID=UPI000D1C6271|nr:hypothetical protein [Staphylococcus equorum]PTE43389.1 hypothetical protein BUY77_05690 [Staphylococcus equorum]RIL46383.1 hypothetical protein BUY82_10975 [Staphylococcus equorum]